jgi:hypothetical protein
MKLFFSHLATVRLRRGNNGVGQCGHLCPIQPEVDPFFLILMRDRLVRWRRACFLPRDDADAPLPAFTGSLPIPQPN